MRHYNHVNDARIDNQLPCWFIGRSESGGRVTSCNRNATVLSWRVRGIGRLEELRMKKVCVWQILAQHPHLVFVVDVRNVLNLH
eukprot:3657619-Amphidinium_carterae.1